MDDAAADPGIAMSFPDALLEAPAGEAACPRDAVRPRGDSAEN